MKLIKTKNLNRHIDYLSERQDFPAVSIYLNTSKHWVKNEKAKIKLKNILDNIRDNLLDNDVDKAVIKKLLRPVKSIIKKINFWKDTGEGVVFFISKENGIYIKTDKSLPSKYYAGDYFNIKYLIKYLYEFGDYYILAVSINNNWLYKGTGKNVSLMPENDLLHDSLDEALWMKNIEKTLQHHSTRSITKGYEGGAAIHGHGAFKSGSQTYLKRYLEKLNGSINEIIGDYRIPLVLICTDTLFSVYKTINNYPYLLPEHIKGNPDNETDRNRLIKKAWVYVKKVSGSSKNKALEEFNDNFDLRFTGISEILRAAYYGNVGKLYLKDKNDCWGRYRFSNGIVRIDKKRVFDSRDLLNLSVIYTLNNKGEVYDVSGSKNINSKEVSALLRY